MWALKASGPVLFWAMPSPNAGSEAELQLVSLGESGSALGRRVGRDPSDPALAPLPRPGEKHWG